jgi:hypothetical protein
MTFSMRTPKRELREFDKLAKLFNRSRTGQLNELIIQFNKKYGKNTNRNTR